MDKQIFIAEIMERGLQHDQAGSDEVRELILKEATAIYDKQFSIPKVTGTPNLHTNDFDSYEVYADLIIITEQPQDTQTQRSNIVREILKLMIGIHNSGYETGFIECQQIEENK